MNLKLGQFVTSTIDPTKRGMVTGITHRLTGTTYGVTWPDLEEKPHAAEELKSERPTSLDSLAIGFNQPATK